MQKNWLLALVPGLLIGATGCPDVGVDPDEVGTAGPVVEFDPGASIIPFPNNLLINPMTGLVNLPAQCNESASSKATREQVLNALDGFGTYEVGMRVTFTEPVDMASLTGKIVLYKRASGMTQVDPGAAQAVPTVVRLGMTTRFSADCATSTMVNSVTIIPTVPLEQKSIYTVGILSGVTTATGTAFGPSFTWALIRQAEAPVEVDAEGTVTVNRTPLNPANPVDENMNGVSDDLESLRGIALLWNAHAQGLAFLEAKGHQRNDVLLAWEFKTQTTTDPLDPAVANSPASAVLQAPLQGLQSVVLQAANRTPPSPFALCAGGDNNTQCFLKITLGNSVCTPATCPNPTDIYTTGNALCGQVGCAAVGDVLAGGFGSKQYQVATPNPFDATKPIPGPWSNPLTPTVVKTETIQVLVFVPASAPPSAGYPAIVFGHGLGSSRTAVFAIGPQLTVPQAGLGFASGFVTVAMDFVAHGSRAVRISNTGACADSGTPPAAPSPSNAPQCYAPFLSPNLAGTRDNIRQSVLDLQGLVESLQACGTTMCTTPNANLQIDPMHVSYAGQSLGGILGSMAVATKTELQSGLLNVAGAGWADIFENTQTLAIRCSLVDGLIAAGVLTGEPWNPGAGTGLCTTDAWKAQPGYATFAATGRWVLDPADPANFNRKLTGRKVLLQEVVGDLVVPNVATDNLGALLQLPAMNGDAVTAAPPFAPSAAITTNPTAPKFLKYTTIAGPPPNSYEHGSLLRPKADAGGQLGTARLQTDGISFLIINR